MVTTSIRLRVMGNFARFSTSTRYCTEMFPVMCRAASATLESCLITICGSSSAFFESGAAELQPMRIRVDAAKSLFNVLQHLLGRRGIFAVRLEIEIFLQIGFRIRIFSH